jgi:hypothetical protein
LDYVNGVERFSPVEVLTVEDLMRTHMMEREKKNKKNIYHVYRNKKPHGEKEKKQALPERRASESRYQRIPGSRDAHDDVTREPTHPPSFFAAA